MEKLFFGGDIVTMDPKHPDAEAVIVNGNKISAVGTLEELSKLKSGNDTEEFDLHGATLMPGLIEPHFHPEVAALSEKVHYIGGIKYKNSADVIEQIKKAVANTPKGKWVVCFGLDFLINRDLPRIDRNYLDSITTEHPVTLTIQSMHTIYANSMALKLVGIDKNSQDTRDGHIYRDETGEPTGVLTEQTLLFPFLLAWMKCYNFNPAALLAQKYVNLKNVGITTCWTAGCFPIFPNYFEILKAILTAPGCPVRNDYSVTIPMIESGQFNAKDPIEDKAKMRFTGVKFWYDGSPYTGNMFLEENYLNNEIMQQRLLIPADQAGERLYTQEVFYELLKKYHNLGYQISVHSQGDRAGRELVDMFEKLLTEFPREDHRHRIEHCAFLTKKDIERCSKLGITLSFHTGHIYYYGEALNDLVVGPERTRKMLAIRTAVDNGMKVSFHSDDPMYIPNPLRYASIAINRNSEGGMTIGADEAISVYDAMKGITIDAAWQQKREHEIGSIEVGKIADFTVLEENPFKVDKKCIGEIKVITTYLDGIDTDKLVNRGVE